MTRSSTLYLDSFFVESAFFSCDSKYKAVYRRFLEDVLDYAGAHNAIELGTPYEIETTLSAKHAQEFLEEVGLSVQNISVTKMRRFPFDTHTLKIVF